MTYTVAVVLAAFVAAGIDLLALRTRLLVQRGFWVAYAIVVVAQLVVNGVLTGFRVVRYDPAVILGPRLAFAPIEDVAFGFAMVLMTLSGWTFVLARRTGPGAPRG